MCGKELVSILIPAYNNPEYTKRTLSSILMQSYRPIEVILIDDNSPNSLKPIFDEFSEHKDDLISAKYFRNAKNLNPYFNLKSGFGRISGKYLIIMPHDDWFVCNYFISKSIDYMERFPNCYLAIGNSIIETNNSRMFSHDFATDPFELNGKVYLKKYLFRKLHPAYSAVLMNFKKLTELDYTSVLISEQEANIYDITPDEAFLALALLSENGSVLISNEIVSIRGTPNNSYSKSDEWIKLRASGVFFPHYHLLTHFLNTRAYGGAISIFKVIVRSSPEKFSQIYKHFKRNGYRFYLVLMCMNYICNPIFRFINHPFYTLTLLIPIRIRRMIRAAKKL